MMFDQILTLTRANLKVRYRQSAAGFLWVVLNPLLTLTVQSYAFHFILRLDIPNFFLFLLSGLLPWIFMTQTLDMSTTIFVNHGRVTKDYQINPAVFLGAAVLENFVNFLLAFALVLTWQVMVANVSLLQLGVMMVSLIPLFIGVAGLCFLLASLHALYRDVKHVVSFVLYLAFFASPIFYPENFVPESWRWLVQLNFLYQLIQPVREALISTPVLSVWGAHFIQASLIAFSLTSLSFYYWRWRRNDIQLYL